MFRVLSFQYSHPSRRTSTPDFDSPYSHTRGTTDPPLTPSYDFPPRPVTPSLFRLESPTLRSRGPGRNNRG